MQRVLTLTEACMVLRISPRTGVRYIQAGELEARRAGRRWFLTEEGLRRFLEGRRPQPPAPAAAKQSDMAVELAAV